MYIPAFSLLMHSWYCTCPFRDTIALIAILLPKVDHQFLNVGTSGDMSLSYAPFVSGPMASTTADFWRMVWEYQIRQIVMLTGLFEAGKVKSNSQLVVSSIQPVLILYSFPPPCPFACYPAPTTHNFLLTMSFVPPSLLLIILLPLPFLLTILPHSCFLYSCSSSPTYFPALLLSLPSHPHPCSLTYLCSSLSIPFLSCGILLTQKKCHQYWPDSVDQPMNLKDIFVLRLSSVAHFSDYIIRKLQLSEVHTYMYLSQ